MGTRRPGPVLLAKLAIAGAVLAGSVWFLGLIHVPVFAHRCGFWAAVWAYRLRMLAFLLPGLVGLSLMLWAEKRFRRGFMDDVWTHEELDGVRSLVARGSWNVVAVGWSTLVVVSAILFGFHRHDSSAAWCWYLLMLPAQTIQRMRTLITPRPVVSSGLRDWRSFKPIQSDHWGERGLNAP